MSILLVLDVPPAIRAVYHQGLLDAFPDQHFDLAPTANDVDPFLANAEILVTHGPYLRDRAAHMFANMPRLRFIQGVGVGVDNIVDVPTLRPEICVANIQGVHGPQMAEMALMLMLTHARQFPRSLANKSAHRWERWPARLLTGKTLGILGVGSIALATAQRCAAMGMRVLGISSSVRTIEGFDKIFPLSALPGIVGEFDYFLILTPYSAQTHHLVGASVLGAMKPDSYLLNLARGGVVDEAALLAALRARQIDGAALDVFETEPLPPDHPFWEIDNVMITCHQGAVHDRLAQQNLPIIIENLGHYLAGDFAALRHVVCAGNPA